jgi:diguanylate cyclase (GGDEF)-like protein
MSFGAGSGFPTRAWGQGYAVRPVSFGRRLAFFFLLIVLVPALALVAVLLAVSQDSRQGKADAQLAAGLDTAVALYEERAGAAEGPARELAQDPQLPTALATLDRADLAAFAESAIQRPDVVAVELDDTEGAPVAAAGTDEGFAYTELGLQQNGQEVGRLKVTSTLAADYVDQLHRLTGREVVVSQEGVPLASTVTPPSEEIQPGETRGLTLDGKDFRAHLLALGNGGEETVLLAGPPKVGGFLPIGTASVLLLIGALLVATFFAYGLARALAGLYTRAAQEALTDPLTGLWNRRRLSEILPIEVDRALRFRHQLSLLIFDVDDFKAINDREGHPQGDAVLRAVADVLRERTRSIDLAARFGGDEMALILLETDFEGAVVLAERLRTGVREVEIPTRNGQAMRVTISVGVATLPDSAVDVEELVDAADNALLRAKRAGKNQIRTAPARNVKVDPAVRRAQQGSGGHRRGRTPS